MKRLGPVPPSRSVISYDPPDSVHDLATAGVASPYLSKGIELALCGVSGNTFELGRERLFRVPHVKGLLHPEPQRRSVTGPLPEPNGHLWRDWRPTRQDSVQELS